MGTSCKSDRGFCGTVKRKVNLSNTQSNEPDSYSVIQAYAAFTPNLPSLKMSKV